MFADYQAEVLRAYYKMKAANQLRTTLIHPTPAHLRDECETVVEKRFQKNDMYALRSFFGEQADQTAYAEAIRNIDIDLFRPLIKLLKGDIKNTDRKNVELLAWLIDYEPRPFRQGDPYAININKRKAPVGPGERTDGPGDMVDIGEQVTDMQPVLTGKPRSMSKARIVVILLGLFFLAGGGTYIFWRINEPGGCMVWTGDHYQPVSCGQKSGEVLVLALDTTRVAHFKKITRPDTITERSVGRVWYSKIDNNVEFFTADGYHPVHVERHLKPLTLYMINKYIRKVN